MLCPPQKAKKLHTVKAVKIFQDEIFQDGELKKNSTPRKFVQVLLVGVVAEFFVGNRGISCDHSASVLEVFVS